MRKILCSIQQGTVGKDRIPTLEAALHRKYAEHFGAEGKPFVIWAEVPRGQAYTEGRLSEGAWLMVEVPDGTDQALRERAMLDIAGEWARVAGVPVEKMMVTLCDSSLFGRYLAANSARMRTLPRIGFLLRTLAGLVRSRRRDGYASVAVNY
jgi:hypothetical protein